MHRVADESNEYEKAQHVPIADWRLRKTPKRLPPEDQLAAINQVIESKRKVADVAADYDITAGYLYKLLNSYRQSLPAIHAEAKPTRSRYPTPRKPYVHLSPAAKIEAVHQVILLQRTTADVAAEYNIAQSTLKKFVHLHRTPSSDNYSKGPSLGVFTQIHIRKDWPVKISDLPHDLTPAEAVRICRLILAYAGLDDWPD